MKFQLSSSVKPTWRLAVAIGILALLGCPNGQTSETQQSSPETEIRPVEAPEVTLAVSTFGDLTTCRIEHYGPFLDLGQLDNPGLPAYRLQPMAGLHSDSWQGQSHTRYERRTATYDFWVTNPIAEPHLLVRAQAGATRRLSVSLDGRALGTRRAKSAKFGTLHYSAAHTALLPGRHQVRIRWTGRQRGTNPAFGMIRWLEFRETSQSKLVGRAPHRQSLFADIVLAGTVRRALILRNPTQIACPMTAAPGTQLKVDLGFWGEGQGVATIAALRDGLEPLVLGEFRVAGGKNAKFRTIQLSLDALGGQPFHLQFGAPSGTPTGAIAFAEPRVTVTQSSLPVSKSRLAVIVVLSGLHRNLLPPVANQGLPHLRRFALKATRFSSYRVPTTYVGGTIATLVTGQKPASNSLDRRQMALGDSVNTLPESLRAVSGASAMFTAVPQTWREFGFDQGWNLFSQYSPVNDISAEQPVLDAHKWLGKQLADNEDRRLLLMVHLRGAHPPWDVTRSELSSLAPKDYNGILEARRGGIVLASVRQRRRRSSRRLTNSDWIRLRTLQRLALAKQDNALGDLFNKIRSAEAWDNALVMVMGDVSTGDPPQAPFGDGRPLSEARLVAPLWVKFPYSSDRASTIRSPVTSVDVARTVSAALELDVQPKIAGLDLHSIASGVLPSLPEPLVATREDSYSTTWGSWLLKGTSPKQPVLCRVDVDPSCSNDLVASHPLLTEALWKKTYQEIVRHSARPQHKTKRRVKLTPETTAALRVWGE